MKWLVKWHMALKVIWNNPQLQPPGGLIWWLWSYWGQGRLVAFVGLSKLEKMTWMLSRYSLWFTTEENQVLAWSKGQHSPRHFPILYPCSISQNAVIANFKQDQGWPIPSRRNLSDREFKDYMQLLPLLNKFFPQSSLPDCLFWKPHSKGHFPVKSCYNNLTVPNHGLVPWPWITIRSSNFPYRVKYSPWNY